MTVTHKTHTHGRHQPTAETADRPRRPSAATSSRVETGISCLTQSLDGEDFASATAALANGIRAILDCHKVALATASPTSNHVRVVALSNGVAVNRRAELVVMIEDALRQVVAAGEVMMWTDQDAAQSPATNGLRQLALEMGVSSVVCSPIRNGKGETVGAFFAANNEVQPSHTGNMKRLAKYESLFAGCLTAAEERFTSTAARAGKRFLQKIKSKRIVTAIGLLVAVMLCGLLPWTYRLTCDCKCEPVHRRYVAAPFEGTLQTTHVIPGQKVSRGELLAKMDGRELRSELAGLRAKRLQAEQRYDAALSLGRASEAQTERLEIKHIKLQISVLEKREQALEIRSPLDGVVVSGDLKRAEGVPLKIGQRLYEIAPLSAMIAEVAIPEDEVASVKAGMPTNVWFDANPNRRYQGTIERIHPRAEMRDDKSVFIAEVELTDTPSNVLPGMNGVARIKGNQRTVGWILFHRPWNAVRRAIGW